MTPMMQHYLKIKEQYKDCILFYRLGDFYEMFFGDAITASKMLEIALTGRDCGESEKAPMCGVPVHSADTYIAKLVSKGYRIAICEQVGSDSASNLKEREVVRVITQGTMMYDYALDSGKNNFLCSLYVDDSGTGLAFVDITTGELNVSEANSSEMKSHIMNQLALYSPSEIIVNPALCENALLISGIKGQFKCSINSFREQAYERDSAEKRIQIQFKSSLEDLGLSCKPRSVCALGGLIAYIKHTQKTDLINIKKFNDPCASDNLKLDIYTLHNLELFNNISGNSKFATLFGTLNKTKTPMGSRLLHNWIGSPLTNLSKIQERLDAVKELIRSPVVHREIMIELEKIVDIARIISRLSCRTGSGRELLALATSLDPLPRVLRVLKFLDSKLFKKMCSRFDVLSDVYSLIHDTIDDNAPNAVTEGGIIKKGYSPEVDDRRLIIKRGLIWINELAQTEREKLGIKIKVGHNRVFGYYLEINRSDASKVPDYLIRRQTMSTTERYITQEIKAIESKIIEAETVIASVEYEIFSRVKSKVIAAIHRVLDTASLIAQLDVLCSFAQVAIANSYVCPEVNLSDRITIKDGRHPVVERTAKNKMFIPNDICMDTKDNQIYIITGPNMAGKSTYMRQIVLIVLMAQMGSFVPASFAEIGIVDNILTRVGASDDLSMGQSTFMVEMSEVSYILSVANTRSLIIFDEVGRGTSTHDGLSIAWALVEYLADSKKCGAKTLFSTHYHELTDIEDKISGVKNYCVKTERSGEDIKFLRKIVRGKSNDSYGIEVAKLAGVDKDIIKRAREVLKGLKENAIEQKKEEVGTDKSLALFGLCSNTVIAMLQELVKLDISSLSQEEAVERLCKIHKMLKNETQDAV